MKYPDDYFTKDELKTYKQLKLKAETLNDTWRKIGGDELQREVSLATIDLMRFTVIASKRKQKEKQ